MLNIINIMQVCNVVKSNDVFAFHINSNYFTNLLDLVGQFGGVNLYTCTGELQSVV